MLSALSSAYRAKSSCVLRNDRCSGPIEMPNDFHHPGRHPQVRGQCTRQVGELLTVI